MILDITLPRKKSYKRIILDSQKYFNAEKKGTIYEDDQNDFYIFIFKKKIAIQIPEFSQETKKGIENYLDYIFDGQYIGLPENCSIDITLENVEVYYI